MTRPEPPCSYAGDVSSPRVWADAVRFRRDYRNALGRPVISTVTFTVNRW